MPHAVALALLLLWTAGNIYVWSLKQDPPVLFWESLGIGVLTFPTLFWYVKRFTK